MNLDDMPVCNISQTISCFKREMLEAQFDCFELCPEDCEYIRYHIRTETLKVANKKQIKSVRKYTGKDENYIMENIAGVTVQFESLTRKIDTITPVVSFGQSRRNGGGQN